MGYNTDAYMRKKSRTKKQQEREQMMSAKGPVKGLVE